MAPAHHGVEHLVCGRTTETWLPLLIALSTLFVDARRSSKTPRPEKVTKVARNCTKNYSVDWRPKSAFKMMYIFYQARPNHGPKILGVQGVTRLKHVKLHAPGVQFSTPRACCTTLRPIGQSIYFIRLNRWLRRCFTLLITPLDVDGIGQNWEDSNKWCVSQK